MKVISSVFLLMLSSLPLFSQRTAIPLESYGVWNRGEVKKAKYNQDADYFLGTEASTSWSKIQPAGPDKFDFSVYQEAIDKAAKDGKVLKLSINVGPDAPMWIYDHGVPMVLCHPHVAPKEQFPNFPYYLDEDHKKYYFKLIREFAAFLRNQPAQKRKAISFVQVKTGCTGDECAYKGEPKSNDQKISKSEWLKFRLESFEVYKDAFNNPDKNNTEPITLLFNAVDPEKNKTEYAWLNHKIDPQIGYGIKGSAYMRGHHLTGEKSFKEKWLPFLVNPKGMKLFSAAEMDQTWQKHLYNINPILGFYWGALGGLNTGLSSWNISKSACEYAEVTPEVQDIFRFFNKYAGQIYPATATAGYSVFHEGLNSANTTKFPEAKYGEAKEKNIERYVAICNDPVYAKRGARMDHPKGATLGQVRQRDSQTGYNDAGWDIEEGNYERWVNQIDPDKTSIGLFRVRGTIDTKSSMYDRFARSFESATGKNTMYFRFDKEMFPKGAPKSLKFTITWLDKLSGSNWQLVYTGKDGKKKTALTVTGKGDNTWKKEVVTINDALVNGKGDRGSDFMFVNTDKKDDIFHGVEVDIVR
ncbi:MAG: hypothetical protein ACRC9Q_05280 [Bacteroidales bacterium]